MKAVFFFFNSSTTLDAALYVYRLGILYVYSLVCDVSA